MFGDKKTISEIFPLAIFSRLLYGHHDIDLELVRGRRGGEVSKIHILSGRGKQFGFGQTKQYYNLAKADIILNYESIIVCRY